jgi:hypothetical protein
MLGMSTGTIRAAGHVGRRRFERQWHPSAVRVTAVRVVLLAAAIAGAAAAGVACAVNVALHALIPPLWRRGTLAKVSVEVRRLNRALLEPVSLRKPGQVCRLQPVGGEVYSRYLPAALRGLD